MTIQTIYLLGTAGVTPNFFGNTQLNGSAPTGANSAFGWGPAKTAVTTPYFRGRLGATTTGSDTAVSTSYNAGTTHPTPGTGTGAATAGDSFVVGPLSGTFANTAWTFNFNLRAGTAGCVGHVNMRMWRGTLANGSNATQVLANTAGATVTLSTSADVNSSITASPGQLILNNEYLFFQIEWQETTAGSSNNDNVFFRIGTASITTADFVAAATGTLSITQANQTVTATGTSPAVGTLTATQANQTVVAAGGPRVTGTLNRIEVNDTLVAAGTVVTVGGWSQGIDFRATATSSGAVPPTFAGDPAGYDYDLATAAYNYPRVTAQGNTVGFQNAVLNVDGTRDRDNTIDPRLAGMIYNAEASPAIYTIDLPAPGDYSISLALGDASNAQAGPQRLEIFDTATSLLLLSGIGTGAGQFCDAAGNLWSAAAWPSSNVAVTKTFATTKFVMNIGGSSAATPIATLFVQSLAAGGAVTGTLNRIEAPDTLAATGTVPVAAITGTLNVTELPDTLTAVARVTVGGTLSQSQAAQTLVANVTVTVTGTLNLPQAANTLVAAGGPRVGGTLNQTQAAQTVTSNGVVTVSGALNRTETNDTLVSVGGVSVRGTLAVTETNDIISAHGGDALWSPADLGSNLLVWLDAADTNSITITGSGVSRWNDKSGNSRHVDQTNDTYRPSYASNKITFVSQQHLLCNDFTAYPTVYDCFAIGRLRNAPGEFCILLYAAGGAGMPMLVDSSGNFGSWSNNGFSAAAGQTWAFGTEGLAYGTIHNINNATWSRDGNALTATSYPVQTSQPSSLSRSDYTQAWGDIYELIFVTYNSSLDTKQRLEGYAAWKWGLVGLLPSNHPYKNAAPAPPPPPVTATLNATQANQTVAATGAVSVTGTLNQPQAAQTLTANGSVTVRGQLSTPQAAQTLTATANVTASGTLNVNQAAQTLTAIGTVRVSGVLALPQAAQTLVATANVTASGTLNLSQAAQTLSANGTVLSGISCSLNLVQVSQSVSAAGSVTGYVANLTITQAPQSIVSTGTVRVSATLSLSQDANTLVSAGVVIPVVYGSLNLTQAWQTLVSAGVNPVAGALAVTQTSQTISSSGHITVSGELTVTTSQTLFAEATVDVTSHLVLVQDDQTLVATGGIGNLWVPGIPGVIPGVPPDRLTQGTPDDRLVKVNFSDRTISPTISDRVISNGSRDRTIVVAPTRRVA
jgi:hypothetical protein